MAGHTVIIGAGISGLTAAYRLHRAGERVTVLEASEHIGGVIHTLRHGGCILEAGPDCWANNKPAGLELARELGLEDQIIGTRPGVRRSFVLRAGRLMRLPEGFFLISPMSLGALLKTPILSPAGKLRMALELLIPRRREAGDESLASFVRRRFGRQALARIAQPMIAGIYTADPEKLSLAATFPQFMSWEREHGSVIRALRRRARSEKNAKEDANTGGEVARAAGPRYGLFVSLREGMDTLPRALAAALPEDAIRLRTPARAVTRDGGGYAVELPDGRLAAERVVVALQAHRAGALLRGLDGKLADALAEVEYAGAAVVNFIFRREQIGHAMDGIGAVIPAAEGRDIIAFSFSSVKFEGRAPEGLAVVRVFMGGALNPKVAALPREDLIETALRELRGLIGLKGEPVFAAAALHAGAMAQYHVGHVERAARLRELEARHAGLALCGNGFDGVGIPDCIRGANEAAARLTA